MFNNQTIERTQESVLATNKVLRNTYALLSMTLVFSGVMAYIGVTTGASHGGALIANIVAIGLLWFVLPRTANSGAGIGVVFAFTGLLGYGLGPMLSYYLSVDPSIVMTALGGTGVIFLGLSGYALTTRKDFSFLAAFVMVGMLVMLGAALLNIFMNIPILGLAISAGIILVMCALILYQTSAIINGGETNYIMATASLFLAMLNIFTSLLHLLGIFGGDD